MQIELWLALATVTPADSTHTGMNLARYLHLTLLIPHPQHHAARRSVLSSCQSGNDGDAGVLIAATAKAPSHMPERSLALIGRFNFAVAKLV